MTMQWKAENVARYYDFTVSAGGTPSGIITAQVNGAVSIAGLYRRNQVDVNVGGANWQVPGSRPAGTIEVPFVYTHPGLLKMDGTVYAFEIDIITQDIPLPPGAAAGDEITIAVQKAHCFGPAMTTPDQSGGVNTFPVLYFVYAAELRAAGAVIAGTKFDLETGEGVRPMVSS